MLTSFHALGQAIPSQAAQASPNRLGRKGPMGLALWPDAVYGLGPRRPNRFAISRRSNRASVRPSGGIFKNTSIKSAILHAIFGWQGLKILVRCEIMMLSLRLHNILINVSKSNLPKALQPILIKLQDP